MSANTQTPRTPTFQVVPPPPTDPPVRQVPEDDEERYLRGLDTLRVIETVLIHYSTGWNSADPKVLDSAACLLGATLSMFEALKIDALLMAGEQERREGTADGA